MTFPAWRAALFVLCAVTSPAIGYDLIEAPPASRFAMNLNLGSASVSTTGYGATTWNALAAQALDAWNQVGVGPNQDHQFFNVRTPAVSGDACTQDGVNEVRFASSLCGLGFGGALAVTYGWRVNGKRVEEDILFDSSRDWDAYSGPLNPSRPDFMRVALHEFGHALGLDHPDDAGQSVNAIMNSHISNVAGIQPDDMAGAHAVEWPISIADIRPAIDSFATLTGIAPGSVGVTSNAMIVANHNPGSAVAITGGTYSIDGGPFTSAAGTISNGQSVRLRVDASSSTLTATTAVLTIESIRSEFSIITAPGSSPTVVNTLPYEPLGAGSSWTYTKNGGPYTRSVQSTSHLFNGAQTVRTQTSEGNNGYLTVDTNGIRQHGGYSGEGEYEFSMTPPLAFVPHMATAGTTTPLSGTMTLTGNWLPAGSTLSYTGSSSFDGFETITVPAGTFNTIRTTLTLTISGTVAGQFSTSTQTGTSWSAPNVGTVKEIVVIDGVPEVYLLTAYSLPPDTTPNSFGFASRSNVGPSQWIESDPALIMGISAPAAITVQGGEYSVDAGPYTGTPGTINVGQSVRVRVMSASYLSADPAVSATLSIGPSSATFTATRGVAPGLAGVFISGPAVLTESATASYVATAIWSDGFSEQVTASWASSLPAIASIDTSGLLTASTVSTSTLVTLSAVYTFGGVPKTAQFFVTVADSTSPPAPVVFTLGEGFTLLGNSTAASLDVRALVGSPSSQLTGITSKVVSLWKWNPAGLRWAFYSPTLSLQQNFAHASANGFDLLTAIQPGEGFWINTSEPLTLPGPGGVPLPFGYAQFIGLGHGWNLVSIDQALTPTQFNNTLAQQVPVSGVPQAANFTSLWAWDAAAMRWYFYSPVLEMSGGLAAVKAYADARAFRHFQDYGRLLGPGSGFWLLK
jgi:hypothetical protein